MDDAVFGGIDQARERMARWAADTRAKAERYEAMSQQAQQVSASASSRDGLVSVTVDSAGTITDLRVTDKIRELPGERIAALVLSTIRRAQATLPERMREIMTTVSDADKSTVDRIVDGYRARFPEPAPEPPPRDGTEELRIGQPEEAAPAAGRPTTPSATPTAKPTTKPATQPNTKPIAAPIAASFAGPVDPPAPQPRQTSPARPTPQPQPVPARPRPRTGPADDEDDGWVDQSILHDLDK